MSSSEGVTSMDAMRAGLVAEATRRFGAARAATLAAEIDALAVDLARVAAAAVPDGAEPGFFLLDRRGEPR